MNLNLNGTSHRIRAKSKSGLPPGIPNDLYDMPMSFGIQETQQ